MNRIPRLLTLLLALAGIGVAGYLTWTHHQVMHNPDFESFCNINTTFNCDAVNASRFSEVWGIPLALYGVGFYLAVLFLGIFGLGGSERARRSPALVWGFSALSVFLSAVLAWLSATAVGAWCVMCISLYVINLGLLATSWASLGLPLGGMIGELDDELRGFYKSPLIFGSGVAFVGALWLGTVALGGMSGSSALQASSGGSGGPPPVDEGKQLLEAYRETTPIDIPLTGEEPFKGGYAAKVVIVEFADFECPWCSKAADSLYEVAESFGDQIKIVYKHFPLDNKCNPLMGGALHDDACAASIAAICAGQQGRFWEMHRTLFSNQTRLKEAELVDYAEGLGLDMDAWGACRTSTEAADVIANDLRAAQVVKVEATPTVLVNGRLIKGPAVVRPDLMEVLIQDLLGAAAP